MRFVGVASFCEIGLACDVEVVSNPTSSTTLLPPPRTKNTSDLLSKEIDYVIYHYVRELR